MTDATRLRILWWAFIAAIVLGILLPPTQTTIFVLGCLMGLAYFLSPVFARIFKRKDNTDA